MELDSEEKDPPKKEKKIGFQMKIGQAKGKTKTKVQYMCKTTSILVNGS